MKTLRTKTAQRGFIHSLRPISGTQFLSIVSLIQSRKYCTRAYTPGLLGSAQPFPQEHWPQAVNFPVGKTGTGWVDFPLLPLSFPSLLPLFFFLLPSPFPLFLSFSFFLLFLLLFLFFLLFPFLFLFSPFCSSSSSFFSLSLDAR